LVLWSRLGNYDPQILERLAYEERVLFEYWAHQASLVLSEDYPIHEFGMRTNIKNDETWRIRTREWIAANERLRNHIIRELRKNGPLRSREIEDVSDVGWESSGWTNQRNVSRMLDLLSVQGKTLVSRREGGQKLWDLGPRCLPPGLPKKKLPVPEVVRRATSFAVGALGVARPPHIKEHFTRFRYPGLPEVLAKMVANDELIPVALFDGKMDMPGEWYMRSDDLGLLEDIEGGWWEPRTTLLSPFDNLICGRDRTEEMFDFYFRLEIYTPKVKRQYGFFVLPILHGDRLIGRIDPFADRKTKTFHIHAVHLEPGAPASAAVGRAVNKSIESLARFVGAARIAFDRVPEAWAGVLKDRPVRARTP
jgi:uncharacterized protein YcaQ